MTVTHVLTASLHHYPNTACPGEWCVGGEVQYNDERETNYVTLEYFATESEALDYIKWARCRAGEVRRPI
jgi:hypothetical protein